MNLQQAIERFRKENQVLRHENQELRVELEEATKRIQELLAILNQDSGNSNWPSSRDKSRQKRQKRTKSLRKKSDKKAGGQEGHQGHTLEFSEKPDIIETHRPTHCELCHTPFTEEQHGVALDKRQVFELPPLDLIVCEHRAETLICPHCGEMTMGAFPEEVKAPVQYGPRVQQLAVYLRTEQFVPYKRSRQFMADLFGVYLSTGTLQNMMGKASLRLKEAVEAIKQGIITSEVVNYDESGFYIRGKRHWLHTAGTPLLTLYFPHERRGKKATDAMGVLPKFHGTAVHDFWSAYRQYMQCHHSLCNAHHLRELTAVEENDEQRWAQHFKAFLVSAKHAVEQAQAEGFSSLPQEKIEQIERLYSKLIEAGLNANLPPTEGWPRGKRGRCKKTKARNLVERLDKYKQEALAFVYDFKVPFDNNLAERDIRMLKVQQKVSGTFRSQQGAEDFCTIRSYTSTMRKQDINIWTALGSVFSGELLLPDT